MDFVAVMDQVIALLRQRGKLTYQRTPAPVSARRDTPGGPQGGTHLRPASGSG